MISKQFKCSHIKRLQKHSILGKWITHTYMILCIEDYGIYYKWYIYQRPGNIAVNKPLAKALTYQELCNRYGFYWRNDF